MYRLVCLFLLTLWLCLGNYAHSQERTSITGYRKAVRPEKPKRKVLQIHVFNTKRVLIGNRCVAEYTLKRGFEYVSVQADPEKHRNPVLVFFQNLGTRTLLTFKIGPFWSVRTRRHINQCRKSSGDFVGELSPNLIDSLYVGGINPALNITSCQ